MTLTSAAPAGGAVVTLTSSNPSAATVPGSVTVAAGATTKTFPVTTTKVTAPTQANITAKCVGASTIVTLTLNPALVGVTVNPAAVTGVAGSTGRVTLGQAAPAGGAVVILASNTPIAATVPGSVTVAARGDNRNVPGHNQDGDRGEGSDDHGHLQRRGQDRHADRESAGNRAGRRERQSGGRHRPGGQHGHGDARRSGAGRRRSGDAEEQQRQCDGARHRDGAGQCHHGDLRDYDQDGDRRNPRDHHRHLQRRGQDRHADRESAGSRAGRRERQSGGRHRPGGQHGHGDARRSGAGRRRSGDADEQQPQCGDGASHRDGAGQCHHGDLRDYDQDGDRRNPRDHQATYNGVAKTATLTVNPAGPAALAGVAMNPATMIFGSVSTGTVTLTAPAPAGGAVIALSIPSSELGLFYLPAFGHGPGRRHDRSVPGDHRNRESNDGDHGELQRCAQDCNADVRLSNSDCVDLHTQPGDRR